MLIYNESDISMNKFLYSSPLSPYEACIHALDVDEIFKDSSDFLFIYLFFVGIKNAYNVYFLFKYNLFHT